MIRAATHNTGEVACVGSHDCMIHQFSFWNQFCFVVVVSHSDLIDDYLLEHRINITFSVETR